MKSRAIALSSLAEIASGYQFRGRMEDAAVGVVPKKLKRNPRPMEMVKVIQIKDIPDRQHLVTSDLAQAQIEQPIDQYLVQQGDVLFLARGHRLFAVPVIDPVQRTIATGYFLILRLQTDSIRPAYLAWYMNQPRFQADLQPFVRGSHMPLVTKSDIQSISILTPPLAIQDTILALDELHRREQELLTTLAIKRAELIQSITFQAATRPAQ
jgi:hypothetical protein